MNAIIYNKYLLKIANVIFLRKKSDQSFVLRPLKDMLGLAHLRNIYEDLNPQNVSQSLHIV